MLRIKKSGGPGLHGPLFSPGVIPHMPLRLMQFFTPMHV
jgi:hypothetical protein